MTTTIEGGQHMLMIILIPVLVYALIKWFHYYCLLRGLIYFAIKEHN